MTSATLVDTNSTVVVTLSGVDETVTQMMYARHTYAPQDILWNYRFVDLVSNVSSTLEDSWGQCIKTLMF